MVEPIAADIAEGSGEVLDQENPVLKLQLVMATNSINHEYARIEFEDTLDTERKDELLEYMENCRHQYFEARESLVNYDQNAVMEFEADLLQQKMKTLNRFCA